MKVRGNGASKQFYIRGGESRLLHVTSLRRRHVMDTSIVCGQGSCGVATAQRLDRLLHMVDVPG